MNNAIDIALMRIHTQVPKEILNLMFRDRDPWEINYTIDQLLLDHVLRYRILKNMNISGGKIKDIFLRPEYREKMHYTKDDAFFHEKYSFWYLHQRGRKKLCPEYVRGYALR